MSQDGPDRSAGRPPSGDAPVRAERSLGPGLPVAAAFIGPGTVTTATPTP